MDNNFLQRLERLERSYAKLITRTNEKGEDENGIYCRYKHPVLTAGHTPLFWRYDLNAATNPFLMERIGINSVFNAGAIKMNGKYYLIARV